MTKQVSLNEFLEREEATEQETFVVDSEEKANWVLRKMAGLEEQQRSNIALAEAETAKIDAWLGHVNSSIDNDLDYFQSLLSRYAEQLRQDNPKFKSVKLPNGKISYRKQQAQWQVDEPSLIASLKQLGHDDLIKIKEAVNKAELKKRFKVVRGKVIHPDTGEVIKGVIVQDRDDVLKVDLS